MNICALCLSWVPDGKYPCLDAHSIITLLFQRNAWSSMCGVVHLTKGIWAWGRVMEMQPSTLSSYENNRLTFFEAIKHADLSLSVSKCKWGMAALAHPAPVLWMRPMVVLNIPKGISHCHKRIDLRQNLLRHSEHQIVRLAVCWCLTSWRA